MFIQTRKSVLFQTETALNDFWNPWKWLCSRHKTFLKLSANRLLSGFPSPQSQSGFSRILIFYLISIHLFFLQNLPLLVLISSNHISKERYCNSRCPNEYPSHSNILRSECSQSEGSTESETNSRDTVFLYIYEIFLAHSDSQTFVKKQ